MAKEIISRQITDKFRMRVVKENKDLVAIHGEANRGDCFGWEDCQKVVRLRREEIKAAAELLGLL